MSNVIDIITREPVKLKRPRKRKVVQEVIESVYQRRHQIDDIAIGYFEKSTGQFRFALATTDQLTLRLLQLHMQSYFEAYAEIE